MGTVNDGFTPDINIDVRTLLGDPTRNGYRVQIRGLCIRYGKLQLLSGDVVCRSNRSDAIASAVREWRAVRRFAHVESEYYVSNREVGGGQ